MIKNMPTIYTIEYQYIKYIKKILTSNSKLSIIIK